MMNQSASVSSIPIVLLVHGTWPYGPFPKAAACFRKFLGRPKIPRWHEEGSCFREDLIDRCGLLDFLEVKWSGANTVKARVEAAEEIRVQLHGLAKQRDRARLVVAHSHGGTAVFHALCSLPDEECPDGIVLMATPFAVVSERRPTPGVMKMTRMSGWIWAMLLASALIYWTIVHWVSRLIPPNAEISWQPALLINAAIVLAAYSTWRLAKRGRTAFAGAWLAGRERLIRDTKLSGSVRGSLLVLRAPNDEATIALASASFVTWLQTKLWALCGWVVRQLVVVSALYTSRLGRKILGVATAIAAVLVVAQIGISGTSSDRWTWPVIGLGILAAAPISSVMLSCVFAFLLVPPLLVILPLGLWPFGVELTRFGLTLEASVETVPPGIRCPVELLDPKSLPEDHFRHSMHELSYVRKAIAEWICTINSLRNRSM